MSLDEFVLEISNKILTSYSPQAVQNVYNKICDSSPDKLELLLDYGAKFSICCAFVQRAITEKESNKNPVINVVHSNESEIDNFYMRSHNAIRNYQVDGIKMYDWDRRENHEYYPSNCILKLQLSLKVIIKIYDMNILDTKILSVRDLMQQCINHSDDNTFKIATWLIDEKKQGIWLTKGLDVVNVLHLILNKMNLELVNEQFDKKQENKEPGEKDEKKEKKEEEDEDEEEEENDEDEELDDEFTKTTKWILFFKERGHRWEMKKIAILCRDYKEPSVFDKMTIDDNYKHEKITSLPKKIGILYEHSKCISKKDYETFKSFLTK